MNRLSWIVISIFMLMSTGCATSSMYPIGEDFSSDNVSKIEKGKTTKDDIVKMFGMPFAKTVSTVSDNDEIWMYVYITETERDQSDVITMELESDVVTTGVTKADQNTFDPLLNDGIISEIVIETAESESEVVSTELANENQNTFDILLKNGIISESVIETIEPESEVVSTELANENQNTFDILLKNGIISGSVIETAEPESEVVSTELASENQNTFDVFLENEIVSTEVTTKKVKSRGNKKTLDVLMKRGVVSGFTFIDGPEPFIEDPTESELSLMRAK